MLPDVLLSLMADPFSRVSCGHVSQEQLTVTDALDSMVKWFCILFNNQFTPDEVYDNAPADRLMHDIALALMATQPQG